MFRTIGRTLGSVLLASAVLPVTAAMAAVLFGGGSTFPAVAVVGPDYLSTIPRKQLSATFGIDAQVDPASIFGAFSTMNAHHMSYCQSGSGLGKVMLAGNILPNGSCNTFPPLGFNAPQVDYVVTDSPTRPTEYTTFNVNRGPTATAIVQFPILASAVVLPFRYDGFAGTLNLSTAQVCGIFAGAINNWSAFGLPAKQIRIVYRGDASGTTFAFTSYLATRCNAANGGPTPANPDGTAFFRAGEHFTPPAAALSANGNPNLVGTVFGLDGAIGYADPGNLVNWWGAGSGPRWVYVDGYDPLSFTFPALPNAAVLTGMVLSGGDPTHGFATTSSAPTASANLPAILAIRSDMTLPTGYPIFAITYLAVAKTGNGSTNAPALRCLGHFIYNHAGVSGCALGRPVLPLGYSYIDDSANVAVRLKLNTAINSIQP